MPSQDFHQEGEALDVHCTVIEHKRMNRLSMCIFTYFFFLVMTASMQNIYKPLQTKNFIDWGAILHYQKVHFKGADRSEKYDQPWDI